MHTGLDWKRDFSYNGGKQPPEKRRIHHDKPIEDLYKKVNTRDQVKYLTCAVKYLDEAPEDPALPAARGSRLIVSQGVLT